MDGVAIGYDVIPPSSTAAGKVLQRNRKYLALENLLRRVYANAKQARKWKMVRDFARALSLGIPFNFIEAPSFLGFLQPATHKRGTGRVWQEHILDAMEKWLGDDRTEEGKASRDRSARALTPRTNAPTTLNVLRQDRIILRFEIDIFFRKGSFRVRRSIG